MDVKEAKELFQKAKTYWGEIYDALREDVRFSIGLDHYTDAEKKRYGDDCMIVPVLPQFIHQVVNDMRQNTPSINVLPGEGNDADAETAKIFKGLIRNIEYKSNADEVYDTASEYSVRGGLGFALVDHDYIDESSFLQELKLRRVHNPLSIYLDPSYVQCDGSDAEYGFILDKINKKDFERKYPGKLFMSFDADKEAKGDEQITIAELFLKTYSKSEVALLDNGEVVPYGEKIQAVSKREIRKVTIKRIKYSGDDVLEETTFPGKYIPIIPFHGEEVWDDGKRNLLSLIRLAKDAQRRVNKWAMKESQILDMAPIAPVQAPFGSIEDFKKEWDSPDDTMVMRYRQTDAAGNLLNKPERLPPPPVPTGIINAMQGAKENVKEALGMYNASIGQKSNAISGVAYDAQKLEADVATLHFPDNRNRSITQIGRILVCAIPEVYDTPRVIQIIGEEETPQTVAINGETPVPGQEQEYDLRKGRYQVRVVTGASYTTKRQEAATLLGDILAKQPDAFKIFGDLYFKNLDVAGADAIASRVRKIIPKELTAEEDAKENGQEAPDPEKMQMAQIIEQLQMQMQQLAAELESKQGDQQLKAGELQIKQQELQIKEAELQLKATQSQQPQSTALEVEKQAFDQQVKERELALKEAEFQLKVMQAQQQPAEQEAKPVGIKLDTTGFQMMKTPEQEAMDAERERVELEDAERERTEKAVKDEQTMAVITTLTAIAAQLNKLTSEVSQPKTVIRDENGLIAGVR